MESLIPIISNLQEVSNAIGDDGYHLPRIVVVGSQGSGKSSVLEKIVGRSFLPKGTGIVTRTPLVLNLVHSPREPGPHRREEDGTLDAEEYGVFSHTETIFTDFDDICSEIQRQTVKIAGHNKGICNEEITLNLYSPRFPNLTLVDLPGLTKFPIGKEPDNVETRIRDLVLMYIENTDAIIMAVVPANTDMVTNESLTLAKDCDRKGDRTLVVLTKVDLMDAGTDAMDILTGKVIPVKLGIVAVVDWSQKDIADKKPIPQVSMEEAQFLLLKSPSLADCNGTTSLLTTLKKLLMKHINDYLVDVSSRVERKILQAEAFYDFDSDDDEEKDRGLMKIITEFSSAFSEDFTAYAEDLNNNVDESWPLNFHKSLDYVFMDHMSEMGVPCAREIILSHIKRGMGPINIMELFMSSPIELLEEASINCAQRGFEEMNDLLWKCAYKGNLLVQNFPALNNKILVVLEIFLLSKLSFTEKAIREESFYKFSRRIFRIRNFHRKYEAFNIKEYYKQTDDKKLVMLMIYIQTSIEAAVGIVYNDVTVTIKQQLVNEVKNKVHDELVGKFSSPGIGRIFNGTQNLWEIVINDRNSLEALYKARDIIGELKEKC